MPRSNKTIKTLRNPEVPEKLEKLKMNWNDLSNAEKCAYVNELTTLGCPYTGIAQALGLTESAIRYYKGGAAAKKASVIEEPYWGNKLEKIMQMDSKTMPIPKAPAPPVPSRGDQVKQEVKDFLRGDALAPQTLDLVTQRVQQWEFCGNLPCPVPVAESPKAVFAEYNPKSAQYPGANIEFLAVSLFRLMPQSYERDRVLRELEAEYRAPISRN